MVPPRLPDNRLLTSGRDAFARRLWSRAYHDLAAADRGDKLAADDLERLALAAFLVGREEESDELRERVHRLRVADSDVDGAARVAFWLALALTLRGEPVRGQGWFHRMQRVLDDAGADDSVWRGYLVMSRGMETLFAGDPGGALALFDQAIAVADRHTDSDLRTLARHGRGQARVGLGDVNAGLAELDEVMVAVTTDDVSPQVVGLVYCAVIDICHDHYDVRRGREWTQALTRWCAAQPDLVPYRGQCLVHRAEILQLHGSWPDAMAEAQRACERLTAGRGQVAAGMALYQRGELHRLRGEADAAAAAYREASQRGHDPQPGLALLRLCGGQVDAALASIRRALDEMPRPSLRWRLLPAYVEIALAAGDVAAARGAAEELTGAAAKRDVPLLTATALHATGAVLLAQDDARAAVAVLRRAWSAWQDVGAPYDAARARALIGQACRALGDEDGAEMELAAAQWVFEQLGAGPDLARVEALSRHAAAPPPGGLTLREFQVLRLVATGATNRAIAQDLFLSEKTVARHVANIFTKLDVSSRAGATAYAYEHHLV